MTDTEAEEVRATQRGWAIGCGGLLAFGLIVGLVDSFKPSAEKQDAARAAQETQQRREAYAQRQAAATKERELEARRRQLFPLFEPLLHTYRLTGLIAEAPSLMDPLQPAGAPKRLSNRTPSLTTFQGRVVVLDCSEAVSSDASGPVLQPVLDARRVNPQSMYDLPEDRVPRSLDEVRTIVLICDIGIGGYQISAYDRRTRKYTHGVSRDFHETLMDCLH